MTEYVVDEDGACQPPTLDLAAGPRYLALEVAKVNRTQVIQNARLDRLPVLSERRKFQPPTLLPDLRPVFGDAGRTRPAAYFKDGLAAQKHHIYRPVLH